MKKRILSTLLAISMAIVGVAASPGAVNVVHAEEDFSQSIAITKEYAVVEDNRVIYAAVIQNTSDKIVNVNLNVTAIGQDGLPIAANDDNVNAVAPNAPVMIQIVLNTSLPIVRFDKAITAKESSNESAMPYLAVSYNNSDRGVVVTVTNTSDKEIRSAYFDGIFLKDNIPVAWGWTMFTDIQPGQTLSDQITIKKGKVFDSADIAVSGARF